MTTNLLESDVMNACRTLFGPGPDISRGFLVYLQPDGAKSAYRKKAKETHPDFFYTEDSRVQQEKTALFQDIMEAYDILNRFFKGREEGVWPVSLGSAYGPSPRNTRQDPAAGQRTAWNQGSSPYYQGPIPFSVLEFGRYLYYSGRISYGQLIEALTWQRKQRPAIGCVALRWGWLIEESIDRIRRAHHMPGRFGEKAVRLGLLTDFQVRILLYYQRTQQERLGHYFVGKNLTTVDELELLANKLNEHNAKVVAARKSG